MSALDTLQLWLRRRLRLSLVGRRRASARFVFDVRYSGFYGANAGSVPIDPHRAENIAAFLALEGLVDPRALMPVRPASLRALRLVHTDDYLQTLGDSRNITGVFGAEVTPAEADRVLWLQRLMAGGTKRAFRWAIAGSPVAVNLAGGLHHARPDSGHGFCIFNDVAIAIADARAHGFLGRVLVVDCDVHDGDGTRLCFKDDPSVHTFSVHNQTLDDAPAVAATTIALGAAVDDVAYLRVLRETLPELMRGFRPAVVVYLAGCDPAHDDRLGNWRISDDGMIARDRLVAGLCAEHSVPMAVVTAGGYGSNAWRYNARFFGELALGQPIEPPHTEEMSLARLRHLRKLADPVAAEDTLRLTDADIYGDLQPEAQKHGFLGFYSLHMIELALERYGVFERLRALGYARPGVEWNLADPVGHTLRLFGNIGGDGERRELVAELCVRRDRATLPEFELLYVEWLMLQHVKSTEGKRPLLPGQRHPGLGMLAEVMGLLVMVCERLKLDGMVFVPAHFHLAALGHGFMRFLTPADEALFRAFDRLRHREKGEPDLSLADVSHAISAGRVRNQVSGEVARWRPAPMVLPLSDALRERVSGGDFDARVAAALEALPLVLAPDMP